MKDCIDCGGKNNGRFKDLECFKDEYTIAKYPLTCNIKLFEKYGQEISNEIQILRERFGNDFDIDLFSLSNLANNVSLIKLASYLSTFKLTSYDCEQLFSILKAIVSCHKTKIDRLSLRNRLMIKYNKSIPIDCEK